MLNPTSNAEGWLASIVESSDDAIIGESLDGVVTSWNAAATRIFGYTAAEAIGMAVTVLAWPGEEARIQGFLEQLRRGERVDHFTVLRRHRDGSKLTVSLSLSPIRDVAGHIVGIAKIARDLTAQIAASQHLADQTAQMALLTEQEAKTRAEVHFERRFREIIESAPSAILQADAAGTISVANPRAEAMFGFARGEMLGRNIESLIPEASRARHVHHRAAFLDAGQVRAMGEGLDLQALRRDGSAFSVEISLSPVQTASGTFVNAVIQDVTERRRTEARTRELQESYMAELRRQQAEAERLNRLKSEFMASVSHELRTPLHTIIGFADLLDEDTAGSMTAKQQRYLSHVRRDSGHLLGLINDILDLSRMEAGGLALEMAAMPLASVATEVVEALQPTAEKRGVELKIEKSISVAVLADRLRVRQVITNLVSNGIKFTPSGGAVTLSAQTQGAVVEVRIHDTGVGVAEGERERIFGKFYQAGESSVGVREGTGLGLAISRQLVEMHGGRIWLESEPGRGSCFHFTLPAEPSLIQARPDPDR